MSTPAEHTRTALSILTAWVTEGQDFAIRYGLRQWSDDGEGLDAADILKMVQGHMRLSALLLQTLAEVTGRDPVDILREIGKEIAE